MVLRLSMKSTLLRMGPRLPSLTTVALCILLLICYHFILVCFFYQLLAVPPPPRHALLNSERLDYISTRLRQMYSLKDSINNDPRQFQSQALKILLDNLRQLEEVVSPWDLAEIKRENQIIETFQHGSKKRLDVCPEIYLGAAYGEPLFERGFETAQCDSVPALGSILTVLLNFHQSESDFRQYGVDIIFSVARLYPGLPILAAIPRGARLHGLGLDNQARPSLTFLQVEPSRNQGDVWNDLINNAKTKYVFLARNLTRFDGDANLERMVREMAGLSLAFVGGATKSSRGHWSMACFQSEHRNYRLAYKAGYSYSERGCVFCDVISGPFMANTRALRARLLDRKLMGHSAFDDLFLRLKRAKIKAAVCPDVMFNVDTNNVLNNKHLWLPMAVKWRMNEFHWVNNTKIEYSCKELQVACKKEKMAIGKTVAPCCLKILGETVGRVLRTCERAGIVCEPQGTTLLGAVKFRRPLPWERSASITFLSSNYTAMELLNKLLKEDGLSLLKDQSTICCTEGRRDGGLYRVVSASPGLLPIKLLGQHLLTSSEDNAGHRPHTQVQWLGQWLRAPRNPALYLRNRYGPEMMRHREWRTVGGEGGEDGKDFSQCPTAGHHDCLDQYNPDGGNQEFDKN